MIGAMLGGCRPKATPPPRFVATAGPVDPGVVARLRAAASERRHLEVGASTRS